MVHILYLAAGSGRRFGANKLLADFHGKPLFLHGMDTLQRFVQHTDCTATVISRYPEILSAARARGLSAVDSPDSDRGVSWTIRAGLAALPPLSAEDYLMFLLADQPCLTEEALRRMQAAAETGCQAATACFDGTAGSPTLFSARLIPALQTLTGDEGGRRILRGLPQVLQVEMPAASCLQDVDCPADLQILVENVPR